MQRMKVHKYHGLGNDYIVIDPRESQGQLDKEAVRLICDRNHGVGSDGILYGPEVDGNCYALRIFNPDGSEAEKSGNGLRIFSRYLWDAGLVRDLPFRIKTLGGCVESTVLNAGRLVRVEMGKVSFKASEIPVKGETGEVIEREIEAGGRKFRYTAATVGNPHCVIVVDDLSPTLAKTYGPTIENDARFPNRTNVQFMKVADRSTIQIEIWERGAGYTLASGSSSTAAAAVAVRLKLCDNSITVKMQGGELQISLSDTYDATMVGPVSAVYDADLRDEFLHEIGLETVAEEDKDAPTRIA